jgi:hypothetical protein
MGGNMSIELDSVGCDNFDTYGNSFAADTSNSRLHEAIFSPDMNCYCQLTKTVTHETVQH